MVATGPPYLHFSYGKGDINANLLERAWLSRGLFSDPRRLTRRVIHVDAWPVRQLISLQHHPPRVTALGASEWEDRCFGV